MHPSLATLICLGSSLGVFAACLWPYNFVETNRASLLPGGRGIRFEAPSVPEKSNPGGILFTPDGIACRVNPGCEKGAVSIEIQLKAATETSGCIKRIVDLRTADGSEAFYMGQWKSYLIVRSFASRPAGGKPYEEIGIADALTAGKENSVAVSSNSAGTVIYLDGQPAKQFPGIRLLKESEALAGHRLYLENSPEIGCPWAGDIYGFAIYGRGIGPGEAMEGFRLREDAGTFCHGGRADEAAACYRFGGIDAERILDLSANRNDLTASRRLFFKKPALHLSRLSEHNGRDFLLNVIGFIPLGFLYFLERVKAGKKSLPRSATEAVMLGVALSLAVELTQAWLPTRDSSMADLIANTAGALTGAAGGILWLDRQGRQRRSP